MLVQAAKRGGKNKRSDHDLEQQYKLLYSKIGRDFITREELSMILQELFSDLDLDRSLSDAFTLAIEKAITYKDLYDNDHLGDFQDLINLDED